MKYGLVLLLVVTSFFVAAKEFHHIKMMDNKTVEGKPLVLNGMALRKVYRFGLPIKVYVAGLYLPKKSQDSKAIIEDKSIKQLVMEYKRGIDRKSIVDGWMKGLSNACQFDCENKKDFHEFKKYITSVGKGTRMILTFKAGRVHVESTNSGAKKGEIISENFRKNLMAVFVSSSHPPSKRFLKEILDLPKKN